MATSTTNYNLVKPDYNESADIEVINSNMDIIDEALNSLSNRISNTVSDYWNNSTIYEVGQYCIYDNKLWKCLVQHSGQTPTNGTYWTQTSIDKEFTELKGDLVKHEEYFKTIAEPKDYTNLMDDIETKPGYINQETGEIIDVPNSKYYIATADYIPCTPTDTIHFYGGIPNELIRWAIYNNDKSN